MGLGKALGTYLNKLPARVIDDRCFQANGMRYERLPLCDIGIAEALAHPK